MALFWTLQAFFIWLACANDRWFAYITAYLRFIPYFLQMYVTQDCSYSPGPGASTQGPSAVRVLDSESVIAQIQQESSRNRVFIFWYVWNVNLFLTFCWKGEIELWLFHLTADIIQRLGSGISTEKLSRDSKNSHFAGWMLHHIHQPIPKKFSDYTLI